MVPVGTLQTSGVHFQQDAHRCLESGLPHVAFLAATPLQDEHVSPVCLCHKPGLLGYTYIHTYIHIMCIMQRSAKDAGFHTEVGAPWDF